MVRYCANCGTEVDETAVFCPTCGQAIDQAAEVAVPPAPSWPERVPDEELDELPPAPIGSDVAPSWPAPERPPPPAAAPHYEERRPIDDDARDTAVEQPAPPPPSQRAPDGGRAMSGPNVRPGRTSVNLPLTWPVTLSAWLIGVGALVGAIGALVGLFRGVLNPVDLLLLIVLLGIAASVFGGASLPAIPHLRLGTLAVVLIGFGVALDRIGFGGAGIGELLLLLGTAAAAIGAVIVELGRDQPLGVPGR